MNRIFFTGEISVTFAILVEGEVEIVGFRGLITIVAGLTGIIAVLGAGGAGKRGWDAGGDGAGFSAAAGATPFVVATGDFNSMICFLALKHIFFK